MKKQITGIVAAVAIWMLACPLNAQARQNNSFMVSATIVASCNVGPSDDFMNGHKCHRDDQGQGQGHGQETNNGQGHAYAYGHDKDCEPIVISCAHQPNDHIIIEHDQHNGHDGQGNDNDEMTEIRVL